jgi:hypothetical protein
MVFSIDVSEKFMSKNKSKDPTAKERMRRYRARLNAMANALGFETASHLNNELLKQYEATHLFEFLDYLATLKGCF